MEDYRRRQLSSSPIPPTISSTHTTTMPLSSLNDSKNREKDKEKEKDVSTSVSTTTSVNVSNITSASGEQFASVRRVVLAVLFFCASSLGAIFVNKACLTHYKFDYPSTLMVLQALLTVILLNVLSLLRPSLVSIVPIKSADYRRLVPSTFFFVSNVTVGLSALSRVNIPMFSAFRRLTVLFVMGAEYLMLHKTHSRAVVLSVFILTAGAFVSALGDVTFTMMGYFLVFLNNALTAAYLASIKRVMRDLNLDPISLLYYTSVMAFPIILIVAVGTRDIQTAYYHFMTSDELRNSQFFLPALSFVAVSAFCVNLSTSICTHVTSPLTTSVAGQVKNILQSVLGFFSWGYVPTPLNVIGLLVALGGQLSFAMFKYRDSKAPRTPPPSDDTPKITEPQSRPEESTQTKSESP